MTYITSRGHVNVPEDLWAEAEAGKMTDHPDDANGRAFLIDSVMGRILTFRSRLAQLEWLCGQEDVTAERLEEAGALLRRQIAEFDSLGDAYRAASDWTTGRPTAA